MTSQENLEIAERVLDAFNRRDLDAFLAFMDPEVELTTRYMEMEGDPCYQGHHGVRDWWQAMLTIFPDFRIEVLEARDLDDSVILTLRVRGRGGDSGVPIDETVWQTARTRNGTVTWWRNFGTEAEALKAARPSE